MTAPLINAKLKPILEKIADPEIPVLTIIDMGVVRAAELVNNTALVKITPTYSGCPAMDVISQDIISALQNAGYKAEVELILHPAWTTDWINSKGRKALENYGIAAPLKASADKAVLLEGARQVKCPQCHSKNTVLISQFGSTPCKAQFKCEDCLEPFDYFKCLK